MTSIAFAFRRLTFVSRLGLVLLLPVVVGCGPGQGKVTGRVHYNGAPLPGGVVLFYPTQEGQNPVRFVLDEQGTYEVVLPAGEVKVSVDNQELKPHEQIHGIPLNVPPKARQAIEQQLRESGKSKGVAGTTVTTVASKLPGKYVEIPKRYYSLEFSNLQFTVQRGDQTHNIELTK
jgi:hypothetical protein